MEKQFVKINLDRYRSHTPGLLSYLNENGETVSAWEVPNGNWGQIVCGLEYAQNSSQPNVDISYNDLMLRYNETKNIYQRGIFTKTTRKSEQISASTCNGPVESKVNPCLTTVFSGTPGDYNFIAASEEWFIQDGKLYRPISEEGWDIVNDETIEYVVILDDYDTVVKNEQWWKNITSRTGPLVDNDCFSLCQSVEQYVLGRIEVPETYNGTPITGLKVPSHVWFNEVEELKDWLEENINSENEDIRKEVEMRGGEKFLEFLRDIEGYDYRLYGKSGYGNGHWAIDPKVPCLTFPTVLTSEIDYGGLYETYVESAYEYPEVSASAISRKCTISGGTIESKLDELMDPNISIFGGITGVMDDVNTIYEAVFKTGRYTEETIVCEYEDGYTTTEVKETPSITTGVPIVIISKQPGPITAITATTTEISDSVHGNGTRTVTRGPYTYEYKWWEFSGVNTDVVTECGDGEDLNPDVLKYRTIPTFDCITNIIKDTDNISNESKYYFLVKKNGGYLVSNSTTEISFEVANAVRIPFTEGSLHNIKELEDDIYMCDYLETITDNGDGTMTFKYVLGGTFDRIDDNLTYREDTGIHCEEKYNYVTNKKIVTDLDGYSNVKIYYNALDMESGKVDIYNEEYRLSRKANLALVTEMEVGSIFSAETMIVAPIFTKEGSSAFIEDPRKIFNLVLDRGVGAAFEKHFKLTECNSFEDLENYGNNYFNL